jgi:V/A-type H+-transporting ATPase subunit I
VAIEKMVMMDMVGYIGDLDSACKSIVLSKLMQPVNALQEIDTSDFAFGATEDNIEKLIDVCYIRPFTGQKDYSNIDKQMKRLKQYCKSGSKQSLKDDELIYDFDELASEVQKVDSKFLRLSDELTKKESRKVQLQGYIQYLECMKGINVPIEEFAGLKNFTFELHKIAKENMQKLMSNDENIPSVLMEIYEDDEYKYVLVFTPVLLLNDAQRVLKSVNSQIIEFAGGFEGTWASALETVKSEIANLNKEISELNDGLKELAKENSKIVYILSKSYELEIKSSEIKGEVACTNEFFYMCGWVPESEVNNFLSCLGELEDRIISIKKRPEEIKSGNLVPPTKLKNNFLVRPFESMVNMYGTPSYDELDPTAFLAITYTILFGAMFGDLGQGLVFLFAGLFLKYKKNRPNFGGVLARLGCSSSIFGLVYGSFFGFEDVIPALVIRPMENIMAVLIYAVIFGCILLIIGYIYGLINHFRKKDIENGIFGKDGLAGFSFYVLALIFGVTKYKGIEIMPTTVWVIILVALLIVIYMREPITNLILHKKPLFSSGKGDYLVEEGFGIAEILLSMFSNTLSFIRVGAFALNHVGLFLAFAALAKMMHTGVGSVAMYVLGNVIIICLEGLIVFIQGLRLEYYELFSKYYEGAGMPFEPIGISGDFKSKLSKNVTQSLENKIVLEE